MALALPLGCTSRVIEELGVCGDGTFAAGDICFSGDGDVRSYDTPGLTAISIRGADFTGDGAVDVLVMGTDVSGVVAGRTLVGDGAGRLGAAVDADLSGCSAHPVPGRLDSEAAVDLLVDECGESVSLFSGTTTGAFTGPASIFVGVLTRSSALVDLSGDGQTEIAVLGSASDERAVFTVTSPTDGTTTTQPVGLIDDGVFDPFGFGIADRDGPDPRLILVDPNTMGGLAVLDLPLQGIAPVRLPVDFVPRGAAVADLDEDGEDELLVTSVQDGALITLEIDAPGEPPREVGRTATDVMPLARQLTDIDGDGHIDLVVSEGGSTELAIWRGRGDGTFDAPVHVELGMVPEQFFLADLNGDSAPDLVAADFTQGTLVVMLAEP